MKMSSFDKHLDALDRLRADHLAGYGHSRMPNSVDDAVAGFLDEYCSTNPETRETTRSSLTPDYSAGLLAFAERMAVLAVRENNPHRVFSGLLAIALEDFRVDQREDLLVLSLLLNSAIKIKADPDDLFDRAAACSRPHVGEVLLQFLKNNRKKKKIVEQMGYKEIMTQDGFDYKRTW
jgi:hypothetical protein